MDKTLLKDPSSEEENSSDESGSEEENSSNQSGSEEENSSNQSGSEEENSSNQSGSEEENSSNQSGSEEENSLDENGSEEENSLDENGSDEENSPDENGSDEEIVADKNTSEQNGTDENGSDEENSSDENSSYENSESEEDDSDSSSYETNLVEEHGLHFDIFAVRKEVCAVEIVMIGHENSGKTQLIERTFNNHPSFTVENYDTHDKYSVYFDKDMYAHILMYDVKDPEHVIGIMYRRKTVFFFCYDVDDAETIASLEEKWLPLSFRNPSARWNRFVVGIQHGLAEAKIGIDQKAKTSIEQRARGLCPNDENFRLLKCSIEEESSRLSVFQSAIDVVYPWTCLRSFMERVRVMTEARNGRGYVRPRS